MMHFLNRRMKKVLLLTTVLLAAFGNVLSVHASEFAVYYTNDRVNFRAEPSLDADVFQLITPGTQVSFIQEVDGWSQVAYNDTVGYIKSEYVYSQEEYESRMTSAGNVELLNWSEAKQVFTIGVDAQITDVRTGLVYYVRSFSNGLHADVEPVTKEDTATLLQTYGGVWQWDPRPVWVTINGRTMAASINGMPHGGGVNPNNGMNGQVCIHFLGSTTHNGNQAFTRDHQDGVMEAWEAALR